MIITLDIETKNGLTAKQENYLLACTTTEKLQTKTHKTPTELWNYIINKGKKLNQQGKKLYVYTANHTFDWYIYAPIKHKQITQHLKKMT